MRVITVICSYVWVSHWLVCVSYINSDIPLKKFNNSLHFSKIVFIFAATYKNNQQIKRFTLWRNLKNN